MPPQTIDSRRFSFERASVWVLLATVVLSILVIIPSPYVPFLPTKVFVLAAGGILTLACYILARLTRGNLILPPLVPFGLLWLPTLAYILSTLFSGTSISSATFGTALEPDTLGFMVVAGFFASLAALILRRAEQYQAFFKTLAYAFGLLLLAQVLILVLGQIMPDKISPTLSIVGSFADLGVLLGLGVITILLTLRLVAVSSRTRGLLMIACAVSLFMLAIVSSALIWILVALAALGLFVEAVMQRSSSGSESDLEGTTVIAEGDMERGEGHRPLAAPLIVLAVSLFFLLGSALGNALANKLHVNVLTVRPSWQSTLAVGHQVYGTSLLFGSGPNTFSSKWLQYRDTSLNQTVFWNVDFSSGVGFIPTSFVTTGAVGAIAWIVFLGLFLFFGIRTLIFRSAAESAVRLVATLSFVGATYLFAIALFDLPNAAVLALAFVFAGVFVSTLRFARGGAQWGIAFSKNPRIGFLIVFKLTLLLLAAIGAAYVLIEHYIAQVDLTRASAALQRGDLATAETAIAHSLSFAPSATAYAAQAQIAQVRLQQIAAATDKSAADAAREFQTTLSAGINAALTATRTAPNDYQNWLALGNLYSSVVSLNVEGSYENAKTAYEKAATLNPTNPTIAYALAQLAIAHKDSAAAKEYLKQAITLKQNYTAAIFLLSQLEVRDGNLKDALAAAEAAAYFTPTDPNVLFQLGLLRAASNNTDGAIAALAASVSANPQFANARYFLAAAYAKKGNLADALKELKAIAALSADNEKAVAGLITSLEAGKNPFPANLLSSPAAPVSP
ncbi:MAG TPA: tetratricopeptide repeat protein [Candidatus Paceibacterota bacterium]|nr:tetratricopeptide repeat protein [Candidatus Paceibacterota bacterium]